MIRNILGGAFVSSGGGGGGGGGGGSDGGFSSGTLPMSHTGNATRVTINTTGMWGSSPKAPTGATVLLDGATADAAHTQPTAASPVVTWLVQPGDHTFTFQKSGTVYGETTANVIFRSFPWKPLGGVNSVNEDYLLGDFATDPTGPFINWYGLNTGYSYVPADQDANAPVGATYCTFATAPGDSQLGAQDIRAETNVQRNWSPIDKPTGGINMFGTDDFTIRWYRHAWFTPTTWTAPVVVKNADNAGFVDAIHTAHPALLFWPNNTNANPTTGDFTASAVITNTQAAFASLSNSGESSGPGVIIVGAPNLSGTQIRVVYQPQSGGIVLSLLGVDAITHQFDTRYDLLMEIRPDIYATGNGDPWIAPAGTITAPRVTAWSSTHDVMPYGVPLKADGATPNPPYGGGFFRIYRWFPSITYNGNTYTNCWKCVTEANSFAVPGATAIYDASWTILNTVDGPFETESGRIYGPTIKVNRADLVTQINATDVPPFNITVTAPVSNAAFSGFGVNGNGPVLVDGERMMASSYTTGTKVLRIVQRGINVPAATHLAGTPVWGQQDAHVWSQGINNGANSTTLPFAQRQWPTLFSTKPATISAAPADNYP